MNKNKSCFAFSSKDYPSESHLWVCFSIHKSVIRQSYTSTWGFKLKSISETVRKPQRVPHPHPSLQIGNQFKFSRHSECCEKTENMNAGSGMRKHNGLHLYCNETGWITVLSPFPKAQLNSWKCVRINSVRLAPQQLNITSLLALLLQGNTLFSFLIVSCAEQLKGNAGTCDWTNLCLGLVWQTGCIYCCSHTFMTF